jgi:phosphatidylglycerol:prolipoprotein diacylglycerol transferase
VKPTLVELTAFGRPLALSSYGLCLALGFLVGVGVAVRRARRAGLDGAAVRDLSVLLVVVGVAGARLLFVATQLDVYAAACRAGVDGCLRPLAVWEGGLVWYGGVAAALPVAWGWARRRSLHPLRLADALVPAVALGHAFGRLGCFLAGCCFGRPSSLAWAVRFPPASLAFQELAARGRLAGAATATPPLHPVQLYEALVEFALFASLIALEPRKRWHGQLVCGWLVGYGLLRAALELVRGDPVRGFVWGPISTSQAIAALSIAAALGARRAFSRA